MKKSSIDRAIEKLEQQVAQMNVVHQANVVGLNTAIAALRAGQQQRKPRKASSKPALVKDEKAS